VPDANVLLNEMATGLRTARATVEARQILEHLHNSDGSNPR
jgi:hypothetical protein